MSLLRKIFPNSSADVGVPGLAKSPPRCLSDDEKAASAAKFLAGYAARKRAAVAMRLIRGRCADLRGGPPSPIAPRADVVAGIRARRWVPHA